MSSTTTTTTATETSTVREPSQPFDPDSPDSKLSQLEKEELEVANKYSSPDVYINGEDDTLWHPFYSDDLEVKPLRFETRSGTWVTVLRSKRDTWLGKHRHRGTVTAVTLKGEWYYKE
jgi:2,4'-dihydroxyacetophenone dioxygenase